MPAGVAPASELQYFKPSEGKTANEIVHDLTSVLFDPLAPFPKGRRDGACFVGLWICGANEDGCP
jgi:hypothetical protein